MKELDNIWNNLVRRRIIKSKSDRRLNMETKSRYEVISDLEEKKRDLIIDRDSLDEQLKLKEKQLKMLRRQIEDTEEEINDFKNSMNEKKAMIEELIKSCDESLKRLTSLNTNKS